MHAFRKLLPVLALVFLSACANIIPPTGGKKDSVPPKLLSIKPSDSLLNTRVTRIEMRFDEYVVVADANKELRISPTMPFTPIMTGLGKTVVIKIPDSLLQDNTTYVVNTGNAIRDLHENNIYPGKDFMFSTGAWFDSLSISGTVFDAELGKLDSSGATRILLYAANADSDAISRRKPLYQTVSDRNGAFKLKGLPDKKFRIYALRENDGDMQYDKDGEYVGFYERDIRSSMDTSGIVLQLFREAPDTARSKQKQDSRFSTAPAAEAFPNLNAKNFEYTTSADTNAGGTKRAQDLNKPLTVFLSRKADSLFPERIVLSADSGGVETEMRFTATLDTSARKLKIATDWIPGSHYILRLLKGFVRDTGNIDIMPSKWLFTAKSEEDYGSLEIHIPKKYAHANFLLRVRNGVDSVYVRPITDTIVKLRRLPEGTYNLGVVQDINRDGKWTTGSLREKRLPEPVIPFSGTLPVKAGWEHQIDFEPKKKSKETTQ